VIERDVVRARELGVEGVAIGALGADGRVDASFVAELIARARPARVVFHRAFDWTPDALEALETLATLGVDRILTAGQAPRAVEGCERLRLLIERAGAGPTIVAAGGIRAADARALVVGAGVRELHLSAARPVKAGGWCPPVASGLASRARPLGPDEHRAPDPDELDAVRAALVPDA
jgi:copper homeostasis protein